MFAGLLNKGLRGGTNVIIFFYVVAFVTSILSKHNIEINTYPNLFYNYFSSKIQNHHVIVLINYFFIAVGVWLMNLISERQEITNRMNYFPEFLYLIIAISGGGPSQLNPQLITNVFVLISVYNLLDTYRSENCLRQIFDSGFSLGVSLFISFSSIYVFILFFIVLIILRPFIWREWISGLFGFVSPWIIFECIAYLGNFNRWYFIESLTLFFNSFRLSYFSEYYFLFSFTLIVLFVLAMISIFTKGIKGSVKTQKFQSILIWFTLLAIPVIFSAASNSSFVLLNFSLPFCFAIGDYFFQMRQIKIVNTLLLVLLIGVGIVLAGFTGLL